MLPLARLLVLLCLFASTSAHAAASRLWGMEGENWSENSRLPDFSRAGYHQGEQALPEVPTGANVRDFGAVGDGKADDSAAIQAAIDATSKGAVYLPVGRYLITQPLSIKRSQVVLRGAGPERTILWFPKGLNEIFPTDAKTSEGRPTTPYSFGGGFVTIEGDYQSEVLTPISAEAKRGDRAVRVESSQGLAIGQRVRIVAHETEDQSLKTYLYNGEPGDISRGKPYDARQVVRIVAIDGDRVTLDRPLRFPTRSEWQPVVERFEPTVRESGIEGIGFHFPAGQYQGHFEEKGANAIELKNVADCWVRDVRLHNADLGINIMAYGNTLEQIVITADAERGREEAEITACTGHHAIQLKHAEDNLVTGFDLRTSYIHDLSLEHASGNVFANGRGDNLALDHHKDTPFENLFTDVDCGAGTRVWYHGGGRGLGLPCAGWGTFWNLRAEQPVTPPSRDFGPPSMIFVGLDGVEESETEGGWWIEAVPTDKLQPDNLYEAQLERRLRAQKSLPQGEEG
ncbi:MAG: glycosyl hydrolase family 28-related protein [Verrucomicrobiota bacterium JB022]|nr:glycosyl hydrolase family 28-related protein [Verrucomicrobiota bacterium JB022]